MTSPRDVAGGGRGQEGHRAGDVLVAAGAADGDALDQGGEGLGRGVDLVEAVLDDPGGDAVDGDALAGELLGQAARQVGDRGLGRAVVRGGGRAAVVAGDRRHVDHPAAALLDHVRDHRLAHQHHAGEVQPQHLVDQRLVQLAQQRPADQAAGVVHQDVDAAVAEAQRLGDQPIDVGLLGDVGLHRDRAPAERLDLLHGGLGLGGAAGVVDDDVGAVARELERDGAADVARSAGDERNLSGDGKRHVGDFGTKAVDRAHWRSRDTLRDSARRSERQRRRLGASQVSEGSASSTAPIGLLRGNTVKPFSPPS